MAFPLSYRMHDDVCMVYLPIHLVESYGKMSKNIPVPWIRFRVFPKRHQARSPPLKKNKTASKPPKTSSHQVLASAGKPIRCRLAFIMISRKASGRLVYREQSDFAGGSKKKTNGKQESILTSNINLHEIIIDVYCIHIITYLQYVDLIQLYIYMQI